MIRYPINHLYVQLESAWLKLRNYNIYSAKVLLIPTPPIQKYIFYRSICDAFFKTNQSDASLHKGWCHNLISKISSISAQVIQLARKLREAHEPGHESRALADQVTSYEALEDLDFIYFILYNTSCEQEVYDRNCKNELVFKSEEYQTLYKYYFDLVSQLSDQA